MVFIFIDTADVEGKILDDTREKAEIDTMG